MPSLSGLHMWRTISSGHSSRSSSSIKVSSGKRFLANSLSDFRLSFSVFCAIIGCDLISRRRRAFRRTLLVSSGRNSRRSSTIPTSATWKIGALGFLLMAMMNGLPFDAGQVLERAADAAGQIDLRLHGLAGRADLARFLQPLGIDHRARATHRRAQRLGQFLGDRDIVLLLDAAADRDQHAVLGDIDIAGFGDDGLEIAASRRQGADRGRFVDDHASGRCGLCLGFERARTDGDHRARGNVAANMRADLSAEFLADQFERTRLRRLRFPARRRRSGIQLDGKSRAPRSIPK